MTWDITTIGIAITLAITILHAIVGLTVLFTIKNNDLAHLEEDVKKVIKTQEKDSKKIHKIDKNLAVQIVTIDTLEKSSKK